MLPYYELRKNKISVINNKHELLYPPHIHNYIEVLYVKAGKQCVFVDNIEYIVNEGELLIIFPNLIHTYNRNTEQRIIGSANEYIITYQNSIFEELFPKLNNYIPENPILKQDKLPNNIMPLLDSLCDTDFISDNNDISIQIGLSITILASILKQINIVKRSNSELNNISDKIIDYISTNFTEPISLETLSSKFGVSKYYISHLFSKKLKINFRQYIGTLRADYSAKLIRTTNLSFTEISAKAGFESQRSFNRIFYSVYKMTPREYKYKLN